MLNILCYGDSNTYGFIPGSGLRYPENERWPGILKTLLKGKFNIIEAGCNARTAYFQSTDGLKQSGCLYFSRCIAKYPVLDWLIIALGINDTQIFYNSSEETFRKGIVSMIQEAKNHCDAKILILSPSVIKENILNSFFSSMFDKTSIEKSKIISSVYKQSAQEFGCCFLDLNDITDVSDIDGLHYTASSHRKIAYAVKGIIVNN